MKLPSNNMKTILVIDDDKDFRLLTRRQLTDNGFNCLDCGTSDKAFEILASNEVDLILSDLNLRKESGKGILSKVVEELPEIPVIIVTGYSNIRSTVDLMRLGAADYILKPLAPKELIDTINATLARSHPGEAKVAEVVTKTPRVASSTPAYVFSPGQFLQKTLSQIDMVAPTNYSVIIYGESGSGKEAFAQEIHKRSARKSKPFLAIDCGALSKELSASILFGHEKGSFTGAIAEKKGVFEMAEGGTVFLDEVANLPYEVQVSLLRMTQERKARRVGGIREISVDVRIIVASNRKLWDACKDGEFREDLYHRLNEFAIDLLPLRERQDDIVFYADLFMEQANAELDKAITGFTPEAMSSMTEYAWPGNLRELRNVVRRSVLSAKSDCISVDDLAWHFTKPVLSPLRRQPATVSEHADPEMTADEELMDALQRTGFNKRKAGKLLGMDIKTVNRKIQQL